MLSGMVSWPTRQVRSPRAFRGAGVLSAPVWISATVLALLFIVFAAMVRAALGMAMGEVKSAPKPLPKLHALVPSILVAALIAGGVAFTALAVLDAMKGGAL